MPLLLCAAILLVAGLAFNLAYLDTGGEQLPVVPGSGSPSPSPFGILDSPTASNLIVVAFAAVLVALFVAALLQRRKGIPVKRVLRPTTWADVVGMLIAFSVFASLVYLWPRLVAQAVPSPSPGTSNATGGGNATFIPAVGGIPLGAFLAAAVFVSILVIALLFRASTRFGRSLGPARPRAPRHIAAQVVRAAIAELEMGGDVRQVILACYARFCAFLGARGIVSQEALTPRELEDLAVRRLSVSADSAESLTALFEEARYSEHTLGDADRDRAVRSLERIRADLEA